MSEEPEETPPDLPALPDDPSLLRSIVEGTVSNSGAALFRNVVRQLCAATRTRHAFVAELLPPGRARTLAFGVDGRIEDGFEWDLAGTPCEAALGGDLCHYPSGVKDRFASDRRMVDRGIESYLGLPLRGPAGEPLGLLAVFDDRPMPADARRFDAVRIFAARVAAELRQLHASRDLAESERRYRDLYEEAPLAYIYEHLESRFISANRAACRLLGLKPEEVTTTFGKFLLAPTPENTERVERALRAMKTEGREFAWVELELRRKDNGEPVWIRW